MKEAKTKQVRGSRKLTKARTKRIRTMKTSTFLRLLTSASQTTSSAASGSAR